MEIEKKMNLQINLPFSPQACLDQRFESFFALPHLIALPWCISTAEKLLQRVFAPENHNTNLDKKKKKNRNKL